MASMNPFRRWTAACGLALAIVAALTVSRAAAQAEAKPAAVIAINSYEKLMADVDWLGGLMNMPGASQMADAMIGQMTGGQGLAGLDKTKPIGVLVDMSTMMPNVAAYLPVSDQAALLALLQPFGITSSDMGNGVTQINAMGQDVYAKNTGGYTLVGMAPEGLGSMPADPTAVLGPLTQQYDVAVQFNVQNLPAAIRQQATAALASAQQSLAKQPNESDSDFEARKQALQTQIDATNQMLTELDQVKLGLAIAGEEQRVYLDVNLLALPGTKLAQEMAESANATTNFAGFANPDAAVNLSFAGKVTGANAAQMEQTLAQVRAKLSESIDQEAPAEARDAIRASVGQFIDAILATVKAGTVDGGAVVMASPDAVTGVAGGLILEPAKIEAGLKSLAESMAKTGDNDMPEIKWNAESHSDIAFHTMQIPVKDDEAKKIFGDQMDVVVGLGGQSAYVAWGKNAAAALKQVIDASAEMPKQATLPLKLTVTVSKIIDTAKSVAPDDKKPVLEMVSSMLASAAGKDHVIIAAQPVENGAQIRFELEQGVIQAIATSAMMNSMGGAQAPVGAGQ